MSVSHTHPTGKPPEERLRIENRFWSKVDFEGKSSDECWEWTACQQSDGYGQINIDGMIKSAHRVAFTLENGGIRDLDDLDVVRHSCDNPPCCNPAHLHEGTEKQNKQDMSRRGRQHKQKLSVEDAKEIKRRYDAEDVTFAELAEDYPVSKQQICRVYNGDRFAYLD